MLRDIANVAASATYGTMWGPSEFTCTGVLKNWDRTDGLTEIDVPALVTRGSYDEMTEDCAETRRSGSPGARLRTFERSAHLAHLEEPELFQQVLREFLRQADPS